MRAPTTSAAPCQRCATAGFDNVSLDLIYGIPGQSIGDLERDLAEAIELRPEHLSCYELEAKPGTRFTHSHGEELERQRDAMEDYFERVVELLTAAGYRWYETANFAHRRRAGARRHNPAYWLGRDYLGIGVGAVSTVDGRARRNASSLRRTSACSARVSARSARSSCSTRRHGGPASGVMLGLRLDEPLALDGLGAAVDRTRSPGCSGTA